METNISPEAGKKFAFLFNVRIDREERLDRLMKNLDFLGSTEVVSLRIRGQFAESPLIEELKTLKNFQWFIGTTFNEWKLDLLEQVSKIDCDYFILMQEDHLPVITLESLKQVFQQCSQISVDFMPTSFYPQYAPFADYLGKNHLPIFEGRVLRSWILTREVSGQIPTELKNYPVNLIGLFSKKLLIKILLTERPILKHYSIQSPFDFEQGPGKTWYLPIKWAFPRIELFACVDDDHGIPGYSLSSRGILREQQTRQYDHHEAGFVFGKVPLSVSLVKRSFIEMCPPRILVLPRNIKYTLQSIRRFRKRRNIRKNLLRASY